MLESLAVTFSLIYVILAARENILCWLAAAISVCLYIYICFHAKLYAETALQIFYLIMAVLGYLNWKKLNFKESSIKELNIRQHIAIIFSGLIISFFLGFVLTTYTDAKMPLLDAFTTVFSVIATLMVIKKILENWLYFIAIDIASIYLYYSRDLNQTAILFILYSIIAIIGYYNWTSSVVKND